MGNRTRNDGAIEAACRTLLAVCDYDSEKAKKELEKNLRYQGINCYRVQIATISEVDEVQTASIDAWLGGDPINARTQYEAAAGFADFLKGLFEGWMCVVSEPRNGRQIWDFEVPLDLDHPKSNFASEYKVRISACVYMIG